MARITRSGLVIAGIALLFLVGCELVHGGEIPTITFTFVPELGSSENLVGRVENVEPSFFQVAVFVFCGGWYNKPTWEQRLTPIREDSSWVADITTGPNDEYASKIAAFLVPAGYQPPQMSGEFDFPQGLKSVALAQVQVERAQERRLSFSGREWIVKGSPFPVGPGPNFFSDAEEHVWVDEQGRLHLNIVYSSGKWWCTEVYTAEPLGYGTYRFTVASPIDELDPNAILGLFTWDPGAPEFHYREIDIEFSRWGEPGNDNAQFVVQPWDTSGNMARFPTVLQGTYSTHEFLWTEQSVRFQAFQGKAPMVGDLVQRWTYEGNDVPPAGQANARINLWLLNGVAPSDGEEIEVIVEAFAFVPDEE